MLPKCEVRGAKRETPLMRDRSDTPHSALDLFTVKKRPDNHQYKQDPADYRQQSAQSRSSGLSGEYLGIILKRKIQGLHGFYGIIIRDCQKQVNTFIQDFPGLE